MADDLYSNYFVYAPDKYKRQVDALGFYIEDCAKFLEINTGEPFEKCKEYVVSNLRKGGKFEFKDPRVIFLDREENGDRVKKETTLNRYIGSSLRAHELVSPTFTTYTNPEKDRSLLSVYIEQNIKKRGVAKKEMFIAEAAGDHTLEAVKKVEQTGRKLANNAISGAFVSASTPLYNKTGHSTLTSTCRTTSGYGNANNEKFIVGNRHYYDMRVVLNNITSIVASANYELISAVMQKYSLHYPTVDEMMECITYSTSMYWWDTKKTQNVKEFVEKLSNIQRAVFCYSGDFYHLRKHNEVFVRDFITKLSDKVEGEHPNPKEPMKKAPESYVNLAHQICFTETKGIGKDYSRIEGTAAIHTLALTIENIAKVVYAYRDLIEAFWMPETIPASVAYFPSSIRKAALTSDTDSTIFTVQDWVIWYSGKVAFDDRSRSVYAAVVFLASSTITHVLAKMSANLGIEQKYIYTIQMKSEFSFDVFVPTQLGKHYFAAISCQEGNVKKELEYEIKGAQLRSANAPRAIIEAAKKMMQDIIHDVMDKGSVSLYKYLAIVADYERKIEHSIRSGNLEFLRNGSIKDSGSYAGEAQDSPYQNHFLWCEVFADKYGAMPAPPYNTKKIPVNTDTPTKLKLWLASIKDEEFKKRMTAYLEKNSKTTMGTYNLPVEILTVKGIPKELVDIVDYEKLQLDICRIFYIILETLGYYAVGDKAKRLVSRNGF